MAAADGIITFRIGPGTNLFACMVRTHYNCALIADLTFYWSNNCGY